MPTPQLYALRWAPPFAQGLVRDLRVRWALEEAGIAYECIPIGPDDQSSTAYRSIQPFGQVPALVDGEVTLFESGALVLYVAERSAALLPREPVARARAVTWVFAALNSIEPPVQQVTEIDLFHSEADWAPARRAIVLERAQRRLQELATVLADREYLDGAFSAGDLVMASVLRIPRHIDLVAGVPALARYVARCEARPAFGRALAAQLEVFAKHAPARA